MNQSGVSLLLELDSPSCEALEEALSMDMFPWGSGKECHHFGHENCLGSSLAEAATDGHSSAWGVLVNGIDQSDEGNHPNKMW